MTDQAPKWIGIDLSEELSRTAYYCSVCGLLLDDNYCHECEKERAPDRREESK